MYGYHINWANVCNNNLDNGISRLVQNGLIILLLTPTYHVSWYVKIWKCVKKINYWNEGILALAGYASNSSVSLRPIFVYFAIVLHMLLLILQALSVVLIFAIIVIFFLNSPFYFSSSNSLNFFLANWLIY